MAEFKPINSQEEFDSAIAGRIERLKRQYEEKYADYDSLKKRMEEAEMSRTDLEGKYEALSSENTSIKQQLESVNSKYTDLKSSADKYKQDIADKDTAIKNYQMNETRLKVARAVNIPYELVGKISGNTEEEMMKDAKTMSKWIAKKGVSPAYSSEVGGSPDEKAELRELARRFGRK